MKLTIILIGLGVVLFFCVLYLNNNAVELERSNLPHETSVETSSSFTTYELAALGLAFVYPSGDSGYTLYEYSPSDINSSGLTTLMLVHANERSMMENPVLESEGPINISIAVIENSKKQFPYQWATENTSYSNVQMAVGDIEEIVVGGANAIRYKVDGLYQMEVVVVAHGEKMYVLTSSYFDTNSPTYRDFGSILESVRFIPQPGQE